MSGEPDYYTEWLGIPEGPRPPDYYALLGLEKETCNAAAIERAAQERNKAVRPRCLKYPDEGTALLNEISMAKLCLLDPETRAAYDRALDGTARGDEPAAAEPEAYDVQKIEVVGTQPAIDLAAAARFCPHCGRKLLPKASFCVECAAAAVGQAQYWVPNAGARCLACSAALTPGQVVCVKCQNDHALPGRPQIPAGVFRHRPFLAHRISLGGPMPTAGARYERPLGVSQPERDEHVKPKRGRLAVAERAVRRAEDDLPVSTGRQRGVRAAPVLLLAIGGAASLLLVTIFAIVWAMSRQQPDGIASESGGQGAASRAAPEAMADAGTNKANGAAQGDAALEDNALSFEIASAIAEANEALTLLSLTPAQLLVLDKRLGSLSERQPNHRELRTAKAGCALLLWVESALAEAAQGKSTVPMSHLNDRLAEPGAHQFFPEESLPRLQARIRKAWFAQLHEQSLARVRKLVAERRFAEALKVSTEEFPAGLAMDENETAWRQALRKAVEIPFVKDKDKLFDERRFLEAYNRFEEFRLLVAEVNPRHAAEIQELQFQTLNEAAVRWDSPRWSDLPDSKNQKLKLLELMARLGPDVLAKYDAMARLLRKERPGSKPARSQ
jgi:hypothetical protein